jgi:hypothetical protein
MKCPAVAIVQGNTQKEIFATVTIEMLYSDNLILSTSDDE